MSFSDAVKAIRKDAQLTQQAFADLIGVSFATINRWENEQQKPSKLALKALQEFCDNSGCVFSYDSKN